MMNRPRTFTVLGLGIAVCAVAIALALAPEATPTTTPEGAVGQAGLRAFADPETGELRQPTRQELADAAARMPAPRSKHADIEIVEHPSGMKSAVLDERFMATSVAKIGPDGKLITECVTSEAEKQAFFADDTSQPKLEVQ